MIVETLAYQEGLGKIVHKNAIVKITLLVPQKRDNVIARPDGSVNNATDLATTNITEKIASRVAIVEMEPRAIPRTVFAPAVQVIQDYYAIKVANWVNLDTIANRFVSVKMGILMVATQ